MPLKTWARTEVRRIPASGPGGGGGGGKGGGEGEGGRVGRNREGEGGGEKKGGEERKRKEVDRETCYKHHYEQRMYVQYM